jgi:hypothetical protein
MNQLPLASVIDIHAHSGPDSIPRQLDAIDLARLGLRYGMRGIVLKNHFEPTASLAYLVRKVVPGIAVFGGVTLNRAVGGMNAAAVERMALVTGGLGRLVWMGSVDTEAQRRFDCSDDGFVPVARDGKLLTAVREVLEVIARYQLVLATGHSTPEEVLLLIREARGHGIERIVVTHAMMAPTHMNGVQMAEAASLGAFIEFSYNGLIGPHKEFEAADYSAAIREVGPHQCILSSDLGQAANLSHPEGLLAFFTELLAQGFNPREIDCMCKHNPADLLNLN